ncbi:fructokinase [Vibrio mangrovi]|uniref:Fructokinase n=1 Tax=Vibrio mangrovi TaxID=474394 RepID=A0A1Y6J058_9VIBR|nr:fructokinase [Vibrio mangrovi]MDW6004901.1 fructokinase [Vibrio mangrovi]SMS01663.1 Fructokinase [Vibrio mangrovi]
MRIGVDLGGTKIEAIALADNGDTLFRQRVPTPRGSYSQTLQAIVDLVHTVEAETGMTGTFGMGIPGTISPYTGRVKNANSVWLNDQLLHQDLVGLLHREVRIANDANCMAVSEAVDGAGAGQHIVLALILGTGCGSGITIDGKPHIGGNGIGGEWGHNALPWPDEAERRFAVRKACYCGRHGCIEQYVSGTGLCEDYQSRSGVALTGDQIDALAAQGDELAQQVLSDYERRLAKSLAAYMNILDPDVVVLAGGVSNIQRLYQNVPRLLPDFIFGRECQTPIRQAVHGDSSGVRGAAWLWPLERQA